MDNNEDISFFNEMMKHPFVINGGLSSVVAGFILAIMVGWQAFLAPILLFSGLLFLAALFVPSSPVFQEATKRKLNSERRESERNFFWYKVHHKDRFGIWQGNNGHLSKQYADMRKSLQSLEQVAKQRTSTMSKYDLDKLNDTTVDFLRLMYTLQALEGRAKSDHNVSQRIEKIKKQMKKATGTEKAKLQSFLTDLEGNLERRSRISFKISALEAQLETMYQTFQEIHFHIMANPGSNQLNSYLKEASSKLMIEEEISREFNLDNDSVKQAMARVAAKAKQAH